MKARVPVLNSKQRTAMRKEINKELADATKEYEKDVDDILIWYLHEEYGFGKKRLEKFIKGFNKRLKDLSDYYEMDDKDQLFIIRHKVKELNLDITE